MEKLRRGEIDATICACPTPVPAFANVKPEGGLHFVAVPYEKSFQAAYLPASISKEDYPALVEGRAQGLRTNTQGEYQLFRIGDAVSSRNIHAAIYDGLRFAKAF